MKINFTYYVGSECREVIKKSLPRMTLEIVIVNKTSLDFDSE